MHAYLKVAPFFGLHIERATNWAKGRGLIASALYGYKISKERKGRRFYPKQNNNIFCYMCKYLYHTHVLDYTRNTHGTFMGMIRLSRNLTDAKEHIYMYIASVY